MTTKNSTDIIKIPDTNLIFKNLQLKKIIDENKAKIILNYLISLINKSKNNNSILLYLKYFIQQNYNDLINIIISYECNNSEDFNIIYKKQIIKLEIIPRCCIFNELVLKKIYTVFENQFSNEEIEFLYALYNSLTYNMIVSIVFKFLLRCHMFHSYFSIRDTKLMYFSPKNKNVFIRFEATNSINKKYDLVNDFLFNLC